MCGLDDVDMTAGETGWFFIGRSSSSSSFLLPRLPFLTPFPFPHFPFLSPSLRSRPTTPHFASPPPFQLLPFTLLYPLLSLLFFRSRPWNPTIGGPWKRCKLRQSRTEPKPKSNLVHFSFKICHLRCRFTICSYEILVGAKCIVCPHQSHSWYGNCPTGPLRSSALHDRIQLKS